jgi:hypothetical protein
VGSKAHIPYGVTRRGRCIGCYRRIVRGQRCDDCERLARIRAATRRRKR